MIVDVPQYESKHISVSIDIQTELTNLLLSIAGCSKVHRQTDTHTHSDRQTQRDTMVASNLDLHGYGSDREC